MFKQRNLYSFRKYIKYFLIIRALLSRENIMFQNILTNFLYLKSVSTLLHPVSCHFKTNLQLPICGVIICRSICKEILRQFFICHHVPLYWPTLAYLFTFTVAFILHYIVVYLMYVVLYRPRHRWVDSIKMGIREIGFDCMDWINLA
jgi:hypothetical protein